MRIVGGQHRGTQLTDVGKGDPKAQLRPTTDRVRENLFNILLGGRFGNPVAGSHVLDLFAGTGALGLEALSRGASHATFVDSSKVANNLVLTNIKKLRQTKNTTIINVEVSNLPVAQKPCELVFLDPPYGQSLGMKALLIAKEQGWIASNALIAWEEETVQLAPKGFVALDQRRYGETWITFLESTP